MSRSCPHCGQRLRQPAISADLWTIRARYMANESTHTIAADYGVTSATIQGYLRRMGVILRKRGKMGRLSVHDRLIVAERYHAGTTAKELARLTGYSPSWVRHVANSVKPDADPAS